MTTPTHERVESATDPSLSLLQRLVDDAMDPGYREASQRSEPKPVGRRDSVAIGVLLFALAILVVAAVIQVRAGAPSDGRTRADLATRVETATVTLAAEEDRVAALREQVDQLGQAGLTGSDSDRALSEEASTLAAAVGGDEVSGPGVEVTLTDGPPSPAGEGGPDLARVLDTDVQLTVNGLFAAGAQAVSVNGQRVTVLSPIRSAGEAVLVGFRPLTPPYVISAVGPESLASEFAGSSARTELAGLEASYGIGVDVRESDELIVPGRADLQLRYAHADSPGDAKEDGAP